MYIGPFTHWLFTIFQKKKSGNFCCLVVPFISLHCRESRKCISWKLKAESVYKTCQPGKGHSLFRISVSFRNTPLEPKTEMSCSSYITNQNFRKCFSVNHGKQPWHKRRYTLAVKQFRKLSRQPNIFYNSINFFLNNAALATKLCQWLILPVT